MKKIIILILLIVVLTSFTISTFGLSFTIISKPDPPPRGFVGEQYKVTFTTQENTIIDRWEFIPANPIPGLELSDTTNVKSVTMKGIPTKAGIYTFTVKIYYKEILAGRREFTIKITEPKYEIFKIQLWPVRLSGAATTRYPRPLPKTIYEGMYVKFIFRTNHTNPNIITWNGIRALPGTSFKIMNASELFPNATPPFPPWLKWLENHLPNAPILVMEVT